MLGILEISSGGIAGIAFDPKLIFTPALKADVSGFLVAHNHPSGNFNTSQRDLMLTKKHEMEKFINLIELSEFH